MDKIQSIKEEPVFLQGDIYESSTSDIPAATADWCGYQDDHNKNYFLIKSEPEISVLLKPKIEIGKHNPATEEYTMQTSTSDVPVGTDDCCGYQDHHNENDTHIKSEISALLEPKIEIEEHSPTAGEYEMQISTSDVPAATDDRCGYQDHHNENDTHIKSEISALLEPKIEIEEHSSTAGEYETQTSTSDVPGATDDCWGYQDHHNENDTHIQSEILTLLEPKIEIEEHSPTAEEYETQDVNKGVHDEKDSVSGTSLHEGRSLHNDAILTVCTSQDNLFNSGISQEYSDDNSDSFNKNYVDSSEFKKSAENALDCPVHGEALRELLGVEGNMLTFGKECICKELLDHPLYKMLEEIVCENEQNLSIVENDEEITQNSDGALSKDRSYDCPTCGKTFNKHSNLIRHILIIHERKHSFSCFTCGKTFSERSNLKAHEVIHTGEENFICSTCGRSFKHRSNLKRHISVIHEGVRSFSCTTCSKTFASQDHLSVHILVHTGERPYSCKLCDKAYFRRAGLKRHMVHHSKGN